MNKCVDEWVIYLSGEQVSINVHQKEILLHSCIYPINPTDSLPLRQLITLGLAGQLGLDLDLVVVTSTPPHCPKFLFSFDTLRNPTYE